jgi:hypothetical protein
MGTVAHQCAALTARRLRTQTSSRGRGRSAPLVYVGSPLNGRGRYGYFLGIPEMRRTEACGFWRSRLGAKPKLPRAFGRSLFLVIRMSACALRPAPGRALVPDLGQRSGLISGQSGSGKWHGGFKSLEMKGFNTRRIPIQRFFLSTRVFSKGLILLSSFAVGGYTIVELSRLGRAKPQHFFLLACPVPGQNLSRSRACRATMLVRAVTSIVTLYGL